MKIGILGAGVMGLTLAYRLAKANHQVEIYESQPQIGGLSTWFDYKEFIFDKYYHVILKSDRHLLALIEELGLSDKLFWKETKTGFLWKGQHVSMSNHWEFLTFPVINLLEKFRLGAGILYSQHFSDPEKLQHITATEWLKSIFGRRVYHMIWEPLLESKFGVLKDVVPAIILWSILNRFYSTRKATNGKEVMGHLKHEGLKILFKTLQESIESRGGKIFCKEPVTAILKESNGKMRIQTETRASYTDRVISTLPTQILKRIAPETSRLESPRGVPEFLGVIRLALVLKSSLSPYYVTNLIDKGLPFTGIIEVSALTDLDELNQKSLVMIPRYDIPSSEWFNKSDQEITDLFIEKLKPSFPYIEEQLIRSFVHREKIVQTLWITPPPSMNEIPISEEGLLWSVNSELCGGNTLNNNAVIDVANSAALQFASSLQTSAQVQSAD